MDRWINGGRRKKCIIGILLPRGVEIQLEVLLSCVPCISTEIYCNCNVLIWQISIGNSSQEQTQDHSLKLKKNKNNWLHFRVHYRVQQHSSSLIFFRHSLMKALKKERIYTQLLLPSCKCQVMYEMFLSCNFFPIYSNEFSCTD